MKLQARLVPYLLLGILTLGAGLGIWLGLSEAPSGSTTTGSATYTVLVPAGDTLEVPVGTKCHVSRNESDGTLVVCTRNAG